MRKSVGKREKNVLVVCYNEHEKLHFQYNVQIKNSRQLLMMMIVTEIECFAG